jgi:hypothetical protein
MKKIFKYVLLEAVQKGELPTGAKILAVQVQQKDVCVWVLVDPGAKPEPVTFHTIPTGQEFETSGKEYIGTVQMAEGHLVFHVFVERP